MSRRDNKTLFITIAMMVCCLSLNIAHAATVNGPATLAVSASDGALDLDLTVYGDLYFEAGEFAGDSLFLSADVAIHLLDETTLWPYASAGSLNLDDSESITVDGDVRLTGDASWDNSKVRLTSTGTIFVNSSGLQANHFAFYTGEVVLISEGRVVGTIEGTDADGTHEPGTSGAGSSGAVIRVGRGGLVQNIGRVAGAGALEFNPGSGVIDFTTSGPIFALEVSSVPLPGSLVLFALGITGMAGMRRARRPSD